MRRVLAAVLLVAGLATAGCSDDPKAESAEVVETTAGKVEGVDVDGVSSWKGIPYAAPPVGDLRWRPPQPVAPWDGTRDASSYGPACVQGPPNALTDSLIKVGSTSEDCLTLNVHRPTDADADSDGPLPVMVWIHGGGFSYGSGSQAVYNSPDLVKRGVVLVTINYRLGRLGFLAHRALQEGDTQVANYGLLDQIAALTWVQDNIEAFGGDPDNVTIFGESAGGASVNALMTIPSTWELFDKAISQSGLGREPTQSWDDAIREADDVTTQLLGHAATADELRALSADQVMAAPIDILAGQAPILDDLVTEPVAEAFAAGHEAPVPYLVGTTDLEVPNAFFEERGDDTDQLGDDLLGDLKPEALAAYGDEAELDRHLLSDRIFTEPARYLADEHADAAPTYRYRFGIASDSVLDLWGGAPHSTEVPYVFDDLADDPASTTDPVPGGDALAARIADFWVEFATDGTVAGWPTEESGGLMSFTRDGPVIGPDPWTTRLDVVEQAVSRTGVGDTAD